MSVNMGVKTGIPGMDELTGGGFPEGTINLISGPAGSAKTLFGMQYIFKGFTDHGEKGLYISLEESRDNLTRAARSFGMDYDQFMGTDDIQLIDFGEIRKEIELQEDIDYGIVSLRNLLDFILQTIKVTGAKRLLIDSISAVGLYYSNIDEFRRELFRFCRILKDHDITTVLITESSQSGDTRFGIEQFIADSIIVLDYENVEGEYRRTLTIYKMRFTRHDPYKHPFLITKQGMEIDHEEIIY